MNTPQINELIQKQIASTALGPKRFEDYIWQCNAEGGGLMAYERMRDVSIDIQKIAEETGFDYDFLCSIVSEMVHPSHDCPYSYEKAVKLVRILCQEVTKE